MAKKGLGIELGTILITAFAIFAWISLFTYHAQDPSFFTLSTEGVLNSCGAVGATLSSLLLQFFGLASFLLPVGFLFVASRVHSNDGLGRALSTVVGVGLSVISLTVFFSLHWKAWHWAGTEFLTGGVLGAWLSLPLEHALNKTGASIVSLSIFAGMLVIATPIGVANFLSKLSHAVGLVSYRIGRLIATYAAYYGAIIANKCAKWLGMQAKKSFEQIRARAEAYRIAKAEAKAALVHEMSESEAKAAAAETEAAMIAASASRTTAVAKTSERASPRASEKSEGLVAKVAAVVGGKTKNDVVIVAANQPTPPEFHHHEAEASDAEEYEYNVDSDDAGDDESDEAFDVSGRGEESIISVADLRAAKKSAEGEGAIAGDTGPVIEKAVSAAESESSKPKFKFDKKRGKWKLPIIDFLRKAARVETAIDRDRLTERANIVSDKLEEFGIDGEVTAMRVGPVITLYEFKPGPGIKVSRISGLVEDLSMALSSKSVRILAPLPGKAVVGIEIPSEVREQVLLREFLQTGEFANPKYQIPVVMGKDIAGQSIFADLAKMPHLLVSGQTGSGKSVFMNGLICSMLFRFTPDELRLILVDPKFIEFSFYHDIPHLLLPVVDDPKNASASLKWAVREMERRYRILEAAGVRNLQSYNDKVNDLGAEAMAEVLQKEAQEQETSSQVMTGGDWIEAFEKDDTGAPIIGKMPYIVIIIDELADLMMTVKKDVEGSIARIAQKARAAGIHLVIATQRPSTDVITGLIKANMPTRVSFSLSSQIDSRTILDRQGAERLLGQGDMLFIPPGQNEPVRLQGAFIDDNELTKITDFLREQGKPAYRNEILIDPEEQAEMELNDEETQDPLFEEALYIVRSSKSASASFLQRRLQIGYNRAARIIEMMESRGIVGPADGARPREILMP